MPLEKGSSRAVISRNIDELTHHGSRKRPHDQVVAIALSEADKSKRSHLAFGGGAPMMRQPMGGGLGMAGMKPPGMMAHPPAMGARPHLASGGFSANTSTPFYVRNEARNIADDTYHPGGVFTGGSGGRTDNLPRAVAADSFVMPADVISGIGQGSTMAGAKIMDGILSSGPFGTPLPRTRRADGGGTPGVSSVMVADGEYLVPRDKLVEIGRRMRAAGKSKARSDLAAGHEWARDFVDRARKHQKKFLSTAPKPKK